MWHKERAYFVANVTKQDTERVLLLPLLKQTQMYLDMWFNHEAVAG